MNGDGMLVSGSYFPMLGLQPALGRLLDADDDRTIGGHFVAVLSYDYWSTQLGADPTVLNDTIIVNGQALTIVGVAPRGFERHDARALNRRCSCRSRCAALMRPGLEGVRQPAELLGRTCSRG